MPVDNLGDETWRSRFGAGAHSERALGAAKCDGKSYDRRARADSCGQRRAIQGAATCSHQTATTSMVRNQVRKN
jgi:hypothetical protein